MEDLKVITGQGHKQETVSHVSERPYRPDPLEVACTHAHSLCLKNYSVRKNSIEKKKTCSIINGKDLIKDFYFALSPYHSVLYVSFYKGHTCPITRTYIIQVITNKPPFFRDCFQTIWLKYFRLHCWYQRLKQHLLSRLYSKYSTNAKQRYVPF